MGGVRFTEEWVREYRKKREAESRNSAEAGGAPHPTRLAAGHLQNYGIAATGSYERLDSLRDAPPPGEGLGAVTAESLGDGAGSAPHQSRPAAVTASNYGIAATGSYGRLDSLRDAPQNCGIAATGSYIPLDSLRDAPPPGEALRGAKYGNEKVCRGGKRFDSKHEAAVYEELRLRCMAGEYLGLGLQVAFYLPGGIKYLADFVAITKGGGIEVMDAKSEATRRDKVYRLKKRLMKECLGLEIIEV